MINGSDNIAERFIQHSENADGSTARSFERTNENTIKRVAEENTIKGVAIRYAKNLNNLITNILTKYPDQLSAFVIAHGEVPFKSDLVKLALQATLLRAGDIAKQATAIDTTDEDALECIEGAEVAAQSNNTPDNETVLSTDAQAAMKIAIDHMKDEHEKYGGDGSLASVLKDMKNFAVAKGNGSTGEYADYFDLPGLATIPIDTGTIDPLTHMPTITAGPAPSTNTSGVVNSGTGSGILDTITSIFSGIEKVTGSITNAANSTAGAAGAVKNVVSNVGANSIAAYISNNKGTIIFAVIAVAFLLFVVIYTARKTSK